MSYAEAAAQFEEKALYEAAMAELEEDGPDAWDSPMDAPDCELSLFNLTVRAGFEERNNRDLEEQAIPLWLAGWTSENANPEPKVKHFWGQTQVMSWYWRAPSKRPGKPGRRYLSTNQAFNAMRKEQTK